MLSYVVRMYLYVLHEYRLVLDSELNFLLKK